MFRRLVRKLEGDLYIERMNREVDQAHCRIEVERGKRVERRVADLTQALEWHVGVTVEIMNMEEALIMARVDEAKKRGDTFGGQGNEVAKQTCDDINQSVERKLNNDVSPDADKSEDDR